MQLAALAAVISYFWRDVSDLLFGSLSAIGRRDFSDRSLKLAFGIAIGTVPIGIAGLALAKLLNTCTSPIRGLEVVGIACTVMALLLGLAELIARHQRSFERVGLLDCLVVGIAQVGALIPGVSRSGSTLTAALFLGFKREEAARLSLLLGLPAIALAGLKELAELRHAGLDAHGWLVLAVGLVIGSLSALSRSVAFCASSSASRLGPSPSTGHLSARYCSRAWRPDGSAEYPGDGPINKIS